ncbi:MAG: MBL fold metallo-hydrolase [Nitrospinae bacterium]|nr:MBL fold metallo-hydrolase [Nitrospinota bacterium]
MKIQFLGVGSGLNAQLGNTNILVNDSVLIDCGPFTPWSLKEIEKMESISDIIITHLHGDHCYGLEALGFMYYFVLKKKVKLWVTRTIANCLWEEVLKGTMKNIQSKENIGVEASLSDYFDLHYLEDENFSTDIDTITYELIKSEHVPGKESYSVCLLEQGKKSVLFSGDVNDVIDKFVPDAYEYTHIFHDCQLFETGSDIHVSIDRLKRLPSDVRKKLTLMHYGEGIDTHDTSMFHGYAKKLEEFII